MSEPEAHGVILGWAARKQILRWKIPCGRFTEECSQGIPMEGRKQGMRVWMKGGSKGRLVETRLIHLAVATEASADDAGSSGLPCPLSPSTESQWFPFLPAGGE